MSLNLSSEKLRSILGGHRESPLVYLLALEADEPSPNWTLAERVLDWLVQTFQPSPVMTHIEILIPPESDEVESKGGVHFATYVGHTSGWETHFKNSAAFYLGSNAPSWRAIPVCLPEAAGRLRAECNKHVGTEYSLGRYLLAVPPGRTLACGASDAPGVPAHCASLTARCLARAFPGILPQASAYYGPSSLFIEMSKTSRMRRYAETLQEEATVWATVEEEETDKWINVLLRGSNESVADLTHGQCAKAVKKLTIKAINASASGDAALRRVVEKQLATLLVRWSQIQHFGRFSASQPPSSFSHAPTKDGRAHLGDGSPAAGAMGR